MVIENQLLYVRHKRDDKKLERLQNIGLKQVQK